jgi:hypothetical protein
MTSDPRQCRENAARCAELAVAARTPQMKAMFLELSRNWEKLAMDLEDAVGRLVESEHVWSDVLQSLAEAKRLSKLPVWKK